MDGAVRSSGGRGIDVCMRFIIYYDYIKSQGQMATASTKHRSVVNCNFSYPDT